MSLLGSGCQFEVQVNDTVQYFKITTNIDVLLLTLSCLGSVFYDLASATIMSGIFIHLNLFWSHRHAFKKAIDSTKNKSQQS